MYCNNCGKNVENGSVFCTGCGRRLNEIPAVPQSETNIPTQIPETQAPFTAPVTEPTNSGIYEKTQRDTSGYAAEKKKSAQKT